jgi:dGTPase
MSSYATVQDTAKRATDLSALATTIGRSRGRLIDEAAPSHRSEFQRDRDRIIHSSAFRRLEYKTQVFSNHEGDMFRTRLTHSLEVAQVARTIARALQVNEDLTEAISLAHDLGHTPFGHAGQDSLNDCMSKHGGFEHNHQSLRVVDELENRYVQFRGLNLLFETREGILKHCSRNRAEKLGPLGRKILDRKPPSVEAQIANLADEIAYNHHDIDDGLRANLLTRETLLENNLFRDVYTHIEKTNPRIDKQVLKHSVLREMLSIFVNDLISTSFENCRETLEGDDTRNDKIEPGLIGFSAGVRKEHAALKKLLFKHLYRHPSIQKNNDRAKQIVHCLFKTFDAKPSLMGESNWVPKKGCDEQEKATRIADYIAGMTDRFAVATLNDLYDSTMISRDV